MTLDPITSQDQLTRVLNLNAGAVVAFAFDGSCFASNSAWNVLLGPEASTTSLQTFLAEIGEELPSGSSTLAKLCRHTYRNRSIEGWLTNRSGGRRWIRWTITVDEEFRLIFIVGADETNTKLAQIREESERSYFESLYANAAVGVSHMDLKGHFLRANDGFCRLVGYAADELRNLTYIDITHPDDLAADSARVHLLISGELDRISIENRYIRQDGAPVPVHVNFTLIRDEQFAPKMILCTLGEINSKSPRSESLKKTEEYYRTWIDPNDRTYWTASPSGSILDLSDNGGLATGVGRIGLVREGWRDLVHPEDQERVSHEWSAAVSAGLQYLCEYRVRVLTGMYHWVRSQAVPSRDTSGEVMCWYGCTDDIQIQKITEDQLLKVVEERSRDLQRANEALMEARDAALEASISKSQFLANISHEIRTPMNGVIGIASILREQPLDVKSKGLVELICQSGESLIKIIDDILDFSKIEAGRVTLEPVPTDVVSLVSDVIALFQGHGRLKNLVLSAESRLCHVQTVMVDSFRLRQVLTNLVGNSIKFTQEGGVTAIVAGEISGSVLHLDLLIHDTGVGIPPDRLPFVFDSFTQADQSIHREYGGTGLGLAISKNLVELMGGTLTVESDLGKGTTMRIQMPLELAEPNRWLN